MFTTNDEARAARFGGGDAFYGYLRGMRSIYDLQEAVGVVLGCGVRRVNLYALDGAVSSVAGLDNWLKAARRARPRRTTPSPPNSTVTPRSCSAGP
jgi:hypothetical protein